MRGLRTFFGTTALLAGLALAPTANAQVVVDIGVQPVCSYGYYGYAPYTCAPMGYYGPGYFYNGIFLGMGPWGGWGYSHGWGGHRFVNEGGGSYHGGPGRVSYHDNGRAASRGGGAGYRANSGVNHPTAKRGGTTQTASAKPSASHAGNTRPSAPHSAAPHSSGGAAHSSGGTSHGGGGGGEHQGGGEHR